MTVCALEWKPGYLANRSIEFEVPLSSCYGSPLDIWSSFLGYSRHASNRLPLSILARCIIQLVAQKSSWYSSGWKCTASTPPSMKHPPLFHNPPSIQFSQQIFASLISTTKPGPPKRCQFFLLQYFALQSTTKYWALIAETLEERYVGWE